MKSLFDYKSYGADRMINNTAMPTKANPFLPAIKRIESELNDLQQVLEPLQQELSEYDGLQTTAERTKYAMAKLEEKGKPYSLFIHKYRTDLKNDILEKTERLQVLRKDVKIYHQAEDLYWRVVQNETALSNIEAISENFVSENFDSFSNESSIKILTGVVSSITDISFKTMYGDLWTPPHNFDKMRNIISTFANLISEYIEADQQLLWLIGYHLFSVAIAKSISKQWINDYPQFEKMYSKDEAIKAYVGLGLTADCNDSFRFACWAYYSGFVLGNLMWGVKEVNDAVIELRKQLPTKQQSASHDTNAAKQIEAKKQIERVSQSVARPKVTPQKQSPAKQPPVSNTTDVEKTQEQRAKTRKQIEMEETISVIEQANKWLNHIANTPDLFSEIEAIMLRFVNENIPHFSSSYALIRLEGYIRYKANISRHVLPFAKAGIPYADQDFRDNLPPEKERDTQLNLLIQLLMEYVEAKEAVIWVICYQLIVNTVTTVLSRHWENRYPEFEKIETKENAVEAYVESGLLCKDYESLFQLACWLCYNHSNSMNLADISSFVEREVVEVQKRHELAEFKAKMLSQQEVSSEKIDFESDRITLERIDQYSGIEFERFMGSIFESDGYQVEYTQASNDKGIDIIIRRKGISIGVQCKCYNSSVSLSAVQEVFAGKIFYSLDRAMVVTNNYFTKPATDLAESTGVILWDRDVLAAKISLL